MPACLLFLGSSCSTTPQQETLPAPDSAMVLAPEQIAGALLTDAALAEKLVIQDQSFERDAEGIRLARSVLHNKTNQPLLIEVRALFKTTPGETVEISTWRRLLLPPKHYLPQAFPTLNPQVSRFLLEIRPTP
ncbi:MAG: hypothetical protein HC904_08805 [Blastochloris sp.]|nr:hypothetical protein [Blastochloris sp.]